MKKRNLAVIVGIVVILIGAYFGYKSYALKNTNKSSNETSVKKNQASVDKKANPNQAKESSSSEKVKKTAEDKVAKAEASKAQADMEEARKIVDILPAGKDKDNLNSKLDKIATGSNNVAWVKAPTYNGITTLITGAVDVNKVKTVKASVEDKEVAVVLNKDGTFSVDCDSIDAGKTVKIKAYDKNDKEVNSSNIVRRL